jgi:putative FmdB family regulatory protein
MVVYVYHCAECGDFDVSLDMGAASGTLTCPTCALPARRRYTAPLLVRTPAPLATMLAKEEKSRDEPEVVAGPPPRRSTPKPRHPALERLPKLGRTDTEPP